MTKSKYFLLFCIAFILGVFLGSYISIQIWILFLLAGFCISLVFLSGINKTTRRPSENSKNTAFVIPGEAEGSAVSAISPYTDFSRGARNDNSRAVSRVGKTDNASHNKKLPIILILVFLLSGFMRMESGKLNEKDIFEIENLNNQKLLLEGDVSSMPEIKNGKQKIVLKNISNVENNQKIAGEIIVYAGQYPEYDFGDKIKFEGKISLPEDFDGFEYKNYLFTKGIYYIAYYPKIEIAKTNNEGLNFQILKFRKYADGLIKKIFPQPHAGIISAMTLGIKSSISDEVLESFNKTGTRHIIAISGLHMTIVAVVLMFLLLAIGLKRNYAFYFAILGIVFFVALVGFPPSAVRAAVMGGMVLFAVKVGRLASAGNAIVFAGVLMLLYNPNLLRYDTGFQLSFSAILGIIYIFPRLDKIFEKYPDHLNIKSMLLITVSAQLATLPIIINSFGAFSLLSVFANVLILPFVPAVMLGGFLTIILASANLFLAQIISHPIWLVLSYQIEIIKFFAGFDFAYFNFEKTGWLFVLGYYGVLVLGVRYGNVKEKDNMK